MVSLQFLQLGAKQSPLTDVHCEIHFTIEPPGFQLPGISASFLAISSGMKIWLWLWSNNSSASLESVTLASPCWQKKKEKRKEKSNVLNEHFQSDFAFTGLCVVVRFNLELKARKRRRWFPLVEGITVQSGVHTGLLHQQW